MNENVGGTFNRPYTYGSEPIRSAGEIPTFDGSGNQRMVADSNQNVTGTQVSDAFGNQVSATGNTDDPQQWQACALYRTYSQDAGLIQSGCRYYDPQVGRFITRDTDLSRHPYIYCYGDPVDWADPTGHGIKEFLRDCWVGGCTIVGTAIGTFGGMAAGTAAEPGPGSAAGGIYGGAKGAAVGLVIGSGTWELGDYVWDHRQEILKWVGDQDWSYPY